ncbi:thiamine pyrophosphate-dependent dehydrogenase E1 component subunit alpha [Mycobacterium szulgai]|uniref:thiamine pyrophosphate-dependent dehydrogenase E1 component subunit alpha n=1 Tax=Mycobacterium szulgai TaxID=1787 RepID=UPI000A1E9C81|nr:thiamine pyrophosphate-dependent enzyme [Mycobacterium szulgai]MCV7078045.1 thiamine pyrophosphate-dependent dehydrogenase E1 component subunit alpha [Mycobacterium szulgai]
MTCTREGLTATLPSHLQLYRRMWMLRLLDMALEELHIEGLITRPVPVAFGQEAVGVGATAALVDGDVAITTHRPQAPHVGLGSQLGPLIAEMMGRSGGRDAVDTPRVLEQSPLLAIGHGYTQWLDDNGRITLCVTEDGDVDSASFNDAANVAVVWQLPVVILVENIRPALSARPDGYVPDTQLYRKAAYYGMPGVSVDGNDVEAVRDCVALAVERARAGGGPTLVQAITYRTIDFDESQRGGYHDPVGSARFLDPLVFARRRLIAGGASQVRLDQVEEAARREVSEAVAYAKARPPRLDNGELSQTAGEADGQAETRF